MLFDSENQDRQGVPHREPISRILHASGCDGRGLTEDALRSKIRRARLGKGNGDGVEDQELVRCLFKRGSELLVDVEGFKRWFAGQPINAGGHTTCQQQ